MRSLVRVLWDPWGAIQATVDRPRPGLLAAALVAVAVALGAGTLPRQLTWLTSALAPTGDPGLDLHHAAMRAGLVRVILADRLVPPPTAVLAALVLAVAAEPVLSLAQERRRAVWAVVLVGLAPVLLHRLAELAVSYLAAVPVPVRPGEAVALPQRFSAGVRLLWWRTHPPVWLTALDQRFNLLSLWSVALWSLGLARLDGRKLLPWHVALPLVSLGLAALATWWLGPMVTMLVLGSP